MLSPLEQLEEEAAAQGIHVDRSLLQPEDAVDGLYIQSAEMRPPIILLNRHRPASVQTAVLAEELGHHYTCIGNIHPQSTPTQRQAEQRGRKWAIRRLLPAERLKTLLQSGDPNLHDLAEELSLPEPFVREACQYYIRQPSQSKPP